MDEFGGAAGAHRRVFRMEIAPFSQHVLQWMGYIIDRILRMPGLLLLELWFRARVTGGVPPEWTQEIMKHEQISSFLEIILQFARSRNLDESVTQILSYSVVFLSLLFLLLPLQHLISVYLHAASFALLGFGHYMSYRYVQLEQESGGEVLLDSFVSLERHGFHFLAQVMLGLTVSCLLGIQSDLARASLAIYCAPIVARMCGFPVEKLHVAHNFSCSFFMLVICFYLLNRGPSLGRWIKRLYRQLRACFVVRGVVGGLSAIWRRLQVPTQLCAFWLALFVVQLYVKTTQMTVESRMDLALLFLSAVAESTGSALSLLGLAVTVSYAASLILRGAKYCLFGADGATLNDPQSNMMHSGYAEGLTLILLGAQTGLLELKLAQRAFLLGLVLFIVLSALLQSLFDLLEPHLLSLGASHHACRARHFRALVVATALFVGPIAMAWGICNLLPFDIWLLIIMSNCLLTSLQTLSVTVVYSLFWIEAHCSEPWERLDDVIFCCRATTRVLEFVLALLVIAYGLHESIFGQWSWLSAAVLLFHSYFNVWRRLQAGWNSFQMRRKAAENIKLLAKASREQLREHSDVCAICFTDMTEARVTPCGHLFHGLCLRKWLFVKRACPLCHADLNLEPRRRRPHSGTDSEEGYSSEWETESEADDTDEYTLASDDDLMQ